MIESSATNPRKPGAEVAPASGFSWILRPNASFNRPAPKSQSVERFKLHRMTDNTRPKWQPCIRLTPDENSWPPNIFSISQINQLVKQSKKCFQIFFRPFVITGSKPLRLKEEYNDNTQTNRSINQRPQWNCGSPQFKTWKTNSKFNFNWLPR